MNLPHRFLVKERFRDAIDFHRPSEKGDMSGFFHLTNVGDVTKNFHIGKNIEIRKAEEPEVRFISQKLEETSIGITSANTFYEENEKNKYVVLAYKGETGTHPNISHTALASVEIFSGLYFRVESLKLAGFPGGIATPIQNNNNHIISDLIDKKKDLLTLKRKDVDDIGYVLEKTRSFNHPKIDIISILNKYEEIDKVSDSSPFKFLGYMALIESIITHHPRPSDQYDSITKQVATKIELLQKRFVLKLDHSLFFDSQAKRETIWKKIYEYRSCIAHGGSPDFSGKIQLLKSHDNALAFIRLSTRALMRQCLEEPDLIADLKEC